MAGTPIDIPARQDEVGDLVNSFRAMQAGVANSVSRLTELAHRDTLTGLSTRVLFADRLDQAIRRRSYASVELAGRGLPCRQNLHP